MTTVLAVRHSSVANLLLGLNDGVDLLVFGGGQLRLGDLASLEGEFGLQKLVWTQERAQVLCTERGTLVKLRCHCERSI